MHDVTQDSVECCQLFLFFYCVFSAARHLLQFLYHFAALLYSSSTEEVSYIPTSCERTAL